MNFLYSLLVFAGLLIAIICDNIEYCIDSNHHKKEPTKEDILHNQCKPWKQYSCCSEGTTIRAHDSINHYKFNYNHCSDHTMSDKCKKHFVQDLCFYECEPYLKPWVVKVNRSFARERIYKVPICASDCQLWWNDCKDDYTCAHNWARDFKWKNKTNECPQHSECQPMHRIFLDAKDFCESVWDHSWSYTKEDQPCMRIWFDGTLGGNPNKATAEYYASAIGAGLSLQSNAMFAFISLVFYFIIK